VDPDGSTLILSHELCILHRTCPPIRRDSPEPPPENVRRLHVLVDQETGILRSGEFGSVVWKGEARRAAIGDVLKVHEYNYIEQISQMASSIPDHPSAIAHLDPDTAISRWSFESAMRAAGSVCQAVDRVIAGDCRNAFCAVRPPGHHAGPRGIVKCANDPEGGSHGFCLLNNVAIGAAYARSMYRNEGIRKIAIIDFDVHHGNGTEAIIRQLVPQTEKSTIRTPFAFGEISSSTYKPWLDETDIQNVFFASTHGYGNRGHDQPGWFYPASGKSQVSESILHPSMVESPNAADFILSQTWTRMGEESKANCCKIINVGLALPDAALDPQGRSMQQRLDLRDNYRHKVLPHLRDFDPDLIFISAGFDAHKKDTMNFGYVGMVEDDYEWVTEQLVKVANTCCNGRIVSVLEGGYKIHGGIVSPFARSVASHVRGLVDGGRSRELYDMQDAEWESQFEKHFIERRERKKEQEREQLRAMEETNRRNLLEQMVEQGDEPEDPDAPSRKRRRNQVDYKELFKQMQQEGFATG
jgi:acetoin utilization deacetylase AcuC-like enzyme